MDSHIENRLTYKSQFGDYGLTADHNIYRLYDKLGAYEDLGTIEYLTNCIARIKEIDELCAIEEG